MLPHNIQTQSHLIPTRRCQEGGHPQFTNRETESQRWGVTCLSHVSPPRTSVQPTGHLLFPVPSYSGQSSLQPPTRSVPQPLSPEIMKNESSGLSLESGDDLEQDQVMGLLSFLLPSRAPGGARSQEGARKGAQTTRRSLTPFVAHAHIWATKD